MAHNPVHGVRPVAHNPSDPSSVNSVLNPNNAAAVAAPRLPHIPFDPKCAHTHRHHPKNHSHCRHEHAVHVHDAAEASAAAVNTAARVQHPNVFPAIKPHDDSAFHKNHTKTAFTGHAHGKAK